MGFNKPLYQQFYIYVRDALTGNFGTSVLTTNPVMTDIRRVFPATLELATLGTIIGSLSRRAARRARGRQARLDRRPDRPRRRAGRLFRADLLAGAAVAARSSTPSCAGWPFRAASTSSTNTALRRVTGFYLLDSLWQGQWDVFRDVFRHIILPACLLGYFSLAYISRMTRSFMLNELGQEYIVAARAKGLSETRIIWAPCPAQCRRAAGHRHRAVLCRAARRLGADGDGLLPGRGLASTSPIRCRTPT